MSRMKCTALAIATLTLCSNVFAYVGPGAGISVLGSLLGILATIVLAIGAIVVWPLRKMMKRKKAKAAQSSAPTSGPEQP